MLPNESSHIQNYRLPPELVADLSKVLFEISDITLLDEIGHGEFGKMYKAKLLSDHTDRDNYKDIVLKSKYQYNVSKI